ncbi:hypothetical protein ACFL2Q_08025 [Thermodesulfobacteriota bacterium]
MGSFYTNITVKGPGQQQLLDYLNGAGRKSYVSPPSGDLSVVYDEESEEQDIHILAELASDLSKSLSCKALTLMNHDDDILWYQMYDSGTLVDEYDSNPAYFSETPKSNGGPSGGDAKVLCAALGKESVREKVNSILRKAFVFAIDRHHELASVLELPYCAVGIGYNFIELVKQRQLVPPHDMDISLYAKTGG